MCQLKIDLCNLQKNNLAKWDKTMSDSYNKTFQAVHETKPIDRRFSIFILLLLAATPFFLAMLLENGVGTWIIYFLISCFFFYIFLLIVDVSANYMESKREKVCLDIIRGTKEQSGLSKELAQSFIHEIEHCSKRTEFIPFANTINELLKLGIFVAFFAKAQNSLNLDKTTISSYLLGAILVIIISVPIIKFINLSIIKIIYFFTPNERTKQLIYHLLVMEENNLPYPKSKKKKTIEQLSSKKGISQHDPKN
ncbi:hypothetical protein [Streptococcus sp. sy018]|uniref:hypothetical protein n=1 Tax=Streptococcus sp. sy018 TaxID=2600147 RepID=UPI0011B8F447|nr:hypothetical protein [Streptococcus sp. sy018]TWS94823.1 hypothetical protein FRX52_02580 [Streptococcus sp. sy018]